MATATSKAIDEPQIRALIDDRVKAVRTKDVNASMSNLAPDILTFDVVNPLQHIGSDASKKRAEEWFFSFQGPIGYEIRDLSILPAMTWPSPTASAMLAPTGQTENN
jgi:ketosteroid isomerase-like protein